MIVSVAELAVDVKVRPVGSEPEEIDHVAAVETVIVPELYTALRNGYASVAGRMPVTTRV